MDYLVQMSGVLFVMVLMAGLLWLLRRKGIAQFPALTRNRTQQPLLHVVDRLALTPQHSVHLVKVADRAILVGVSPSGCSFLQNVEWNELAPHVERDGRH
jgi:flagellar biosynthetic protein FliO